MYVCVCEESYYGDFGARGITHEYSVWTRPLTNAEFCFTFFFSNPGSHMAAQHFFRNSSCQRTRLPAPAHLSSLLYCTSLHRLIPLAPVFRSLILPFSFCSLTPALSPPLRDAFIALSLTWLQADVFSRGQMRC